MDSVDDSEHSCESEIESSVSSESTVDSTDSDTSEDVPSKKRSKFETKANKAEEWVWKNKNNVFPLKAFIPEPGIRNPVLHRGLDTRLVGQDAASRLNKFPSLHPPPSSVQQTATQKRLQQTQAKVDEVVGIMRVNVEKVLEHDQTLNELDQRADALQHDASQFEQQAGKSKRKRKRKMMTILGVICVVLLIVIIASLWPETTPSSVTTSTTEATPSKNS